MCIRDRFGAAAQFGIFFVTIVATGVFGFDIADAASAGIIAAADGPTSDVYKRQ